ncbi:MAG: alginate export family protein [Candidatus Omnitrophota bacterium]|nr:alginate export family protein [Candidatus Omnitrophota bacterium]
MGKRLIFVLVLAIALGVTCSAFASVQNVKVSGDITATGVVRDNFDLTKTPRDLTTSSTYQNYDDKERDWFTITRVRVDADLTDNVGATVRLLNERNWNGESTTGYAPNRNISPTGIPVTGDNAKELQVDLDLAYVTLKEFLYSPLTIVVGRQELHFGNDWLIGDPDTNIWSGKTSLAEGDLSARKSFDAIRATLDYNPLVIDAMYAKTAENNVTVNDDTTLYGVNAAYAMDKNTNIEGFFYAKVIGAKTTPVTHVNGGTVDFWNHEVKQEADKVFTIGGRVTNKTVKNLSVDLQSAFQFGTYSPRYDVNAKGPGDNNTVWAEGANRRAWGIEALLDYDLKDVAMISKYAPSVSATYVYLSGAKAARVGTDNYTGWDPMFENQTFGHIANAIIGFTNQSLVGLSAKAKPVQDVGVKVDCYAYWLAKRARDNDTAVLSLVNNARSFVLNKTPFLGQEYDLTVTYDYTEDVQFSLLGGVFMPSKAIKSANTEGTLTKRAAASELIGSMKVTF